MIETKVTTVASLWIQPCKAAPPDNAIAFVNGEIERPLHGVHARYREQRAKREGHVRLDGRQGVHYGKNRKKDSCRDQKRRRQYPYRTERKVGGDLAGLTVHGGVCNAVFVAAAHEPDRVHGAADRLYLCRIFAFRLGQAELFVAHRSLYRLAACVYPFGVGDYLPLDLLVVLVGIDVPGLGVEAAEIRRSEGHRSLLPERSEALAEVVVKRDRRVVREAVETVIAAAAEIIVVDVVGVAVNMLPRRNSPYAEIAL